MGSGAGDGVSIRSTTCAIVPMFGRPHLDSLDQAGLGEVVDGDYNGRPAFALMSAHGGRGIGRSSVVTATLCRKFVC